MSAGWSPIGRVEPRALIEPRLELHHAAQLVAAVGKTLLPAAPDDSHPNLGWDRELGAHVGREVGGVRAGIVFSELLLFVQDAAGTERASLPLAGQTLAGALEWLGGALGETGARVPAGGLELPGYELPDHPVASGGAFAGASPAGRAELAAWFANGHAVLEAAAAREGGSEVRTWPHHFDVGSLITVATNPDGSLAASVGLGLSPGDSSYPEPYWYISPWPYPAADALPGLAAGHWHTEGFAAAILTATEQLEAGGDPARTLDAFLSDAISKSRQSLA